MVNQKAVFQQGLQSGAAVSIHTSRWRSGPLASWSGLSEIPVITLSKHCRKHSGGLLLVNISQLFCHILKVFNHLQSGGNCIYRTLLTLNITVLSTSQSIFGVDYI
jgi:hypothetical protein